MKKNYLFYLIPIVISVGLLSAIYIKISTSKYPKAANEMLSFKTAFAVPVIDNQDIDIIKLTDFEKDVISLEQASLTEATPNEVVNQILLAAKKKDVFNFAKHFSNEIYAEKLVGSEIYKGLTDQEKELSNQIANKRIVSKMEYFVIDKPIEHAAVNIIGNNAEIVLEIDYSEFITVKRMIKLVKIDNKWFVSDFPEKGLKVEGLF